MLHSRFTRIILGTLSGIVASFVVFLPHISFAHEIYVLSLQEVAFGLHTAPFPLLPVITQNLGLFLRYTVIAIVVVALVFAISNLSAVRRSCEPFFRRMKKYGAPIARVTIGISFLAGSYYHATYGPELPITRFGHFAPVITVVLIAIGVFIIINKFVRPAALVGLILYFLAVGTYGVYMLTYLNYFGELILLLILGEHHGAVGPIPHTIRTFWLRTKILFGKLSTKLAPYSFFILRVSFGIALLYSAIYAKILHNDLALMVAENPVAGHATSLATLFGFEPHFLVLGAALVEIVIALFFIFGFEIRFISLFLLFWLTLSLSYFGEVVWPHLILIGIPIAFLFYGYDRYTLKALLFRRELLLDK